MKYKVFFNWHDGHISGEVDYVAKQQMENVIFEKGCIGLDIDDNRKAIVNTAQCTVVIFERVE